MERELFAFTDEAAYYNTANDSSLTEILSLMKKHGKFIFSIPQWLILNGDISFSGNILKLINVPIVLLILLTLYEIYPDKRIFFITPIALPYLYIMAFQNMRDPLIWLCVLLTIKYSIHVRKHPIKLLSTIIILYFLRGHMLFALLIVICAYKIMQTKGYSRIGTVAFVVFMVVFLGIGMKKRLMKYYHRATFYIVNEEIRQKTKQKALPKKYQEESNEIKLMIIGLSRQIFSPRPTSMFNKLVFSGASKTNLYMIDIARMVQTSFFYLFLLYILIRWKRLKRNFSELSDEIKLLGVYALINTFVYAFYYFGHGSSRTKFELHLFVFLIYLFLTSRGLFQVKHKMIK